MLFNEITNIIALSYSELGSIGLTIARNFNNGYGKSQKQKTLIKNARLIQMELKTVLDHVVYDDDGNVSHLIRSTDEQINKSLTYLIDLTEIQDYSTGPTLFHKLKPSARYNTATILFQYSVDGLAWHDPYAPGDAYLRVSTDAGTTWTGAILFYNTANDKVSKAGDTMSGNLVVPDGTLAGHAVNKGQLDAAVVGLWDDRGYYDASVGAYPSSGGSGSLGSILKGDIWTISVSGTLPTSQYVDIGYTVRALINSPGNTQSNWAIIPSINDSPWNEIVTIWSPFAQPSSGELKIQYRKKGNIVYAKGLIRATSTYGSGTRIFTFPAGFRPPVQQRVFIPKNINTDEEMHIRILADGDVFIVRDAATFTQKDILLPELFFTTDGLLVP